MAPSPSLLEARVHAARTAGRETHDTLTQTTTHLELAVANGAAFGRELLAARTSDEKHQRQQREAAAAPPHGWMCVSSKRASSLAHTLRGSRSLSRRAQSSSVCATWMDGRSRSCRFVSAAWKASCSSFAKDANFVNRRVWAAIGTASGPLTSRGQSLRATCAFGRPFALLEGREKRDCFSYY